MLLFEDHRYETAAVVHKAVVYAVAFSPDGSLLATAARDGSVFVRDAGGHVTSVLERGVKEQPVHALGYLPGSSSLVVGGMFGWAGYRPDDGGGWHEFGAKLSQQVTAVGVLSERLVAVGTGDRLKASDGTLEIWDVAANRKLQPHFREPNGVRSIATAPRKKLVAWATGHRKVRVSDITSPAKPTDFPQPCDCPAVALSADGTTMAVANDWNAKIYDLRSKRERAVLKGHKGHVLALAFSPDGATLATGSFDLTVRLWDVATGLERANYQWDIGRVYCLTYAPDGLRLAAGGDLGRVIVWDAE